VQWTSLLVVKLAIWKEEGGCSLSNRRAFNPIPRLDRGRLFPVIVGLRSELNRMSATHNTTYEKGTILSCVGSAIAQRFSLYHHHFPHDVNTESVQSPNQTDSTARLSAVHGRQCKLGDYSA
jgi:hypothetical protein